MTIDYKIRDEKLQCNISRVAAKTLALPLGKIDKYEYFTSKQILSYNQIMMIEQAKLAYSPLGKIF